MFTTILNVFAMLVILASVIALNASAEVIAEYREKLAEKEDNA